jgi:hypothetical protein
MMSTHHLYIANPPERALMQIDSYGRGIGLGDHARSVLWECVALAWDDGFAEVSSIALARDLGIMVGEAHAAIHELADSSAIEIQELVTGIFVVRPLMLSSDVGTQAGVGWWQRLEVDYEA